jgi:hypothetical protein
MLFTEVEVTGGGGGQDSRYRHFGPPDVRHTKRQDTPARAHPLVFSTELHLYKSPQVLR